MLKVNICWKGLDEIYKIDPLLLHRSAFFNFGSNGRKNGYTIYTSKHLLSIIFYIFCPSKQPRLAEMHLPEEIQEVPGGAIDRSLPRAASWLLRR